LQIDEAANSFGAALAILSLGLHTPITAELIYIRKIALESFFKVPRLPQAAAQI
jgi:hypothetical protein